ncbi:unannotated protein [freshwater metagenome]|uniref:Unannotated protein n=1 Tax=freshwater metagenome TaxID=449393 RepID=A0A6J7UQK8_9ZZZZ
MIAPTVSTTSVMYDVSRLRMWAISWASTPSSSPRDILASRPVVTVTDAFDGLRPVANAFGAGSLMTYTAGIGTPAAIDTPSTRLRSCAYSGPVAGMDLVSASAAFAEDR